MTSAQPPTKRPGFLAGRLDAFAQDFLTSGGGEAYDFREPPGEASLSPPGGVSWRVFKNPVALFVGGITAVLLELAEPRVRSGVWDHTTFKTDPLARMKRTGLAAMMTVYGARSKAEAMIAKINARHAQVTGVTPSGTPYAASERALLDWVHATAAFGFLEAYCAYVHPLSDHEKDRFYAEGQTAAHLYGAHGAPGSAKDGAALFEQMKPHLERSDIVFEFLEILNRTKILPAPFGLAQPMLIRASVACLPIWAQDLLGLAERYHLARWERALVRAAGRLSDRMVLPSAPAAQACLRLVCLRITSIGNRLAPGGGAQPAVMPPSTISSVPVT